MDNAKAKNVLLVVLLIIFIVWLYLVIKDYIVLSDKTGNIFNEINETEKKYEGNLYKESGPKSPNSKYDEFYDELNGY